MAINMTKSLVSVGVGVLDDVLEKVDREAVPPRDEPFRTATDLGRLGIAAVGYLAQMFYPRYGNIGEAMALSATPLLVKSVTSATGVFREKRAVTFRPRVRAAGRVSEKAAVPPGGVIEIGV